jgi:hypothetical protein
MRQTLLATIVASALFAGCGEDAAKTAGSSTPTSAVGVDKAFVAKADAICVKARDALEAIKFPVKGFVPSDPDPNDLPKVADFLETQEAAHAALVGELEALGAPKGKQKEWGQFLTSAKAYSPISARQIAAARDGDSKTFAATVKEAEALHQRIFDRDADAAGLGTSPCLEVF